jgi:AcrR family transcriptional regulator
VLFATEHFVAFCSGGLMPDGPSAASRDRRVQRTRDGLLDALRALLMESGYERLTIQQILDRADVGRATFYSHFESKDDLLRASLGRMRDGLAAAGRRRPGSALGFTLPLFQHLASHRRLYQMVAVPEHEVTVEREMREIFRGLIQQALTPDHRPTETEALAIQHVVGALWSTIVWWMESGSTLSADEVNARFEALTLPGLRQLLNRT